MVDEMDSFDIGINPKEFFTHKNYLTKGIINSKEPIVLAGMLSIQECEVDDLESDFVKIFIKNYMLLTRCQKTKTGSYAFDSYTESAKARISAEDRKTRIQVDGSQ